jgi:uncharacterized repeat protein (TIGR01451 family)
MSIDTERRVRDKDSAQPAKPRDKDPRRSLIMGAAALMLVVVGYLIVLLIGGQALRNLPGARIIGRIGDKFGDIQDRSPARVPLPALQATPGGAEPAASPVVTRPSPKASPSFIPAAPDAPSTVTFTLEYENTTGVRLTGIRLTDKIPTGTSYRTGSATPDASFDGATLVWHIGTLDPGQTGKVTFQVQTNRNGRISNKATLFSNEAPPSEVESSATVS